MWIPKWKRDELKGVSSPMPTQVVSNEEFIPRPQSKSQAQVERVIGELAEEKSKKLGMDRRAFMASSMGLATCFLAANKVYGNYWDVKEEETLEKAAYEERWPKGEYFIIDVQTHFADLPNLPGGMSMLHSETWNGSATWGSSSKTAPTRTASRISSKKSSWTAKRACASSRRAGPRDRQRQQGKQAGRTGSKGRHPSQLVDGQIARPHQQYGGLDPSTLARKLRLPTTIGTRRTTSPTSPSSSSRWIAK